MPKQLYNEGRVVGMSAYEVYVKQHASIDPVNPPASEREWLASTIAMGSSMLLKLNQSLGHADDEVWVQDIQFPSNSTLSAANTIIASFFRGEGVYNGNWATRISSYGPLISNTANSSPSGSTNHTSNIPRENPVDWDKDEKTKLSQYMKILDGIVIQPGTWVNSANKPPQKDFTPNLADYPRIRLQIKGNIEVPIEILLTGLTIRTVVQGVSGLDSATNTPSPQNGDFLGPGQFPWASKIVFCVPSSYIAYFEAAAYKRSLPHTAESITVNDTFVVDMKTTKPETYYISNYRNARVQIDVDDYSTLSDGTAVLTVYQKSSKYPPAIWGSFIDSTGTNYLNPLDVVAPGTVKMFENASSEDLKDYEDTFDGTFGVNKNTDDGTLEVLGPDGTLVPAADVSIRDINYTNLISSDAKAKALVTKTGTKTGLSISMSSGLAGSQYTVGNDSTSNQTIGNTTFNVGSLTKLTPNSSNITIASILEALANNKSIDILGNNLKAIKAGIVNNYIQFPNGLRLYISPTEPTPSANIPVGSIGIGWTDPNESN